MYLLLLLNSRNKSQWNQKIGPLIPWVGYFIGGFVAYITKQSWSHCKTIAIETGIQNVGVVRINLQIFAIINDHLNKIAFLFLNNSRRLLSFIPIFRRQTRT
jgi:hypothetical protein